MNLKKNLIMETQVNTKPNMNTYLDYDVILKINGETHNVVLSEITYSSIEQDIWDYLEELDKKSLSNLNEDRKF